MRIAAIRARRGEGARAALPTFDPPGAAAEAAACAHRSVRRAQPFADRRAHCGVASGSDAAGGERSGARAAWHPQHPAKPAARSDGAHGGDAQGADSQSRTSGEGSLAGS
ncbi:hypothetical protein EBL87_04180 [Cereibacter sphaeroides]|nr:hypothetical protein EBL87_04180 [Cereibacter sphaeroides]AZB69071.1 hypothetical protein EBL86_12195 [Cereibacter sphaeroides]